MAFRGQDLLLGQSSEEHIEEKSACFLLVSWPVGAEPFYYVCFLQRQETGSDPSYLP